MHRVTTVGGDAAPDVAWRRYALLDRWPGWSPQIRRVEAPATRLVAGLTGTVHGPLGTRVRFRVLAVDETARTWRWRVDLFGVELEMEHGVSPAPGGGCRTTFGLDGPAPVALLYPLLARPALHRLVAG